VSSTVGANGQALESSPLLFTSPIAEDEEGDPISITFIDVNLLAFAEAFENDDDTFTLKIERQHLNLETEGEHEI